MASGGPTQEKGVLGGTFENLGVALLLRSIGERVGVGGYRFACSVSCGPLQPRVSETDLYYTVLCVLARFEDL